MDTGALKELGEYISTSLDESILETGIHVDELTVTVERPHIGKVLTFLRDDGNCRFKMLIDITAVDFPARPRRFEVVYHLLSLNHNHRVRIKLNTDEETPVPSVIEVFPSADWFEREIWDMYGVMFEGHPDLRRIITDYGFEGHPLRKDFPLTGYVEPRYSEDEKRVVYEPVKLTQDFRSFDFMSPWEGAKYILPGDEKAEEGGNGDNDKKEASDNG